MNMKTKRFQRTAAMLLCIFICAWTMFPLMGAAFAAEGLHDTAEAEITCCCDIRCTADCPAPTEAEHRPCRTLYSRHRLIPFTIPENGSVKIPAVLQIPCRKLLQKKSQFTIYFH